MASAINIRKPTLPYRRKTTPIDSAINLTYVLSTWLNMYTVELDSSGAAVEEELKPYCPVENRTVVNLAY